MVLPNEAAIDVRAVRERPRRLLEALSGLRAAIAPTRFLHDAYRTHGLLVPMEIQPFGVDADRAPRPLRKPGPLRVGFIGQIGRYKGCHILIAATRLVPAGAVSVTVWGDMSRNPDYATSLRRAAWGLDITFAGPLSLQEIDGALRSVDILVVPSLWAENAPLTLLQALASKTPCLVSDQPGMTEFVQDGVNGHVFPTGRPRALAAMLRRLATDRDHLDRLTCRTGYERTSDAPSSRKTRLNHGPMFGTRRMRAGGKVIAASAATVLFFYAVMENAAQRSPH
ncbi:MAG: glycosyltransferase [Alphaproteobacteria bacterium]|nr:MAG: glycosyltransferase [Alphaproteobacteria bacterium]